jgi:hypothetical protein
MKYQAVCLVCYTCTLNPKPVSKREAERTATGHMNAYGHNVTILKTEASND